MRRLLACVLAIVVIGESSGVARAFGPGSTVHCCCGEHASARPCHCPSCPTTMLRTPATDHADGHVCAARDCDGNTAGDPGVLRVVATPTPDAPILAVPLAFARLVFTAPLPLHGRVLDAGRPPP